jgi:tetratricopeptide (TPR) repeat protein
MLEQARTALLGADDVDGATEAGVALAEAWWWSGDHDRCAACLDEASTLVRERGSPLATAIVLSQLARFKTLWGDHTAAIETALESLRLAEQLNVDYLRAKNLITLGTARGYMPDGDLDSAIDDITRGMELAQTSGHFDQLSRGMINLGSLLESAGRLDEATLRLQEAHQLARTRGHRAGIRFTEGNLIEDALMRGAWAEAERLADAFLKESEQTPHFMDAVAHVAKATNRLAQDEPKRAIAHINAAAVVARKVGDPQMLIPTLAAAALVYAELDDCDRARAFLVELQPGVRISSVPGAALAAMRCGYGREWRSRVEPLMSNTPWDVAADAVLDRRWRDAADAYDAIGTPSFAALAALRGAEEAVSARNLAEADTLLSRALAFYRSIGAKRYVRAGERLLAATA